MPVDASQYLAMLNPQLMQQQQLQAFDPRVGGVPSPMVKPQTAPVRQMVNVVPPDSQAQAPGAQPIQSSTAPMGAPAHSMSGMSAYAPETSDETDMKNQFLNYMKNRQGNVSAEEQALADEKAKRAGMNGNLAYADLSGLNQFADAMTGSHLAQGYKAPTDIQNADAMIQKLGDSVRKDSDGMGADQLQFLKDQAQLRNNKALVSSMGRMDRLDQADERIHNSNLAKLNGDVGLRDLATSTQNLQNGIQNFSKGGATPAEFAELQQAVRNNIGTKGSGGVEERMQTYANSAGISLDRLKQFLTGDPQSVMKSDSKLANQVLLTAGLELQNKQRQGQLLLKQVTAGHDSFYNRPGQEGRKADYANTYNTFASRFTTPQDIMGATGAEAVNPTGAAGAVAGAKASGGIMDPQTWLAQHRASQAPSGVSGN